MLDVVDADGKLQSMQNCENVWKKSDDEIAVEGDGMACTISRNSGRSIICK